MAHAVVVEIALMLDETARVYANGFNATIERAAKKLVREASIEINVDDTAQLGESRHLLGPGRRIYVSHLPRQEWSRTIAACRSVRDAGFDPVPHIPVRLLRSAELGELLSRLTGAAGVQEVLLIAGDYAQSLGPFSCVKEVLQSGVIERRGIKKISIAGHPEGHPGVPLAVIRQAEQDKAFLAFGCGLEVTFLTQFFFETAPFVRWVNDLRAAGIQTRIVAGLCGPARSATLLKYAMRCGVGASIKALVNRPAAFGKVLSHHGPESVLLGLADALENNRADFNGVHFFCFGGFLQTCEWLDGFCRS